MRQIVLDTETTGLSPQEGHRLTEIGCVEIINRRITGVNFQSYLNPERELDAAASRITGLTYEFLQDQPKFSQIVAEFFAFIGDAEVIIHNAPFDLGFLNHELQLCKHSCREFTSRIAVTDTLALARRLHPGQKNNLDALCKRYKVNNSHREQHGALLDAEILAEVYLAMTAGQGKFALTPDDEVGYQQNSSNTIAITTRQGLPALKVVYATADELIEHQQYLQHIKAESAGVCIWEQQTEEQEV